MARHPWTSSLSEDTFFPEDQELESFNHEDALDLMPRADPYLAEESHINDF